MRRAALVLLLASATPLRGQDVVEPPVPALLEPVFLLSTSRIVDADAFRGDGAILGTTREIAIRDQSLTASDQVFVPQLLRGRSLSLGDMVQFYRIGRRINDPHSGERLGRLLVPTGIGSVDSLTGSLARVRVTHAFHPILIGDFARPVAEADTLVSLLPARMEGLEGHVVALQEEKAIVPPFDRVLLRTELSDRLGPGEVVLVYRQGAVESGRRLPDVLIARAMVVRVEGPLAAAVLFEAYRSDLVPGDRFRRVAHEP